MIVDEIMYLEREYRDRHRGTPKELLMSIENYAMLLDELDTLDLMRFHGMEIVVAEHLELDVK